MQLCRMREKKGREGIQGNWQNESPFEHGLELVKRGSDLSVGGLLMRQAYNSSASGNWESYKEEFHEDGKLSLRASVKAKEWHEKVESEDTARLSIAQDIQRKSTDFLRRINAPIDWSGRCHFHCHCFPLEDYTWWVSSGARRRQQQLVEALDKPAGRWRQSSWTSCFRLIGKESQGHYGRAQEVHRRGHLSSSEGGRLAARNTTLQRR